MAKYDIRVRYAFEGTYTVTANNREEAERIVKENCGLVLRGNIHTTENYDKVDWDFNVHPEEEILAVTKVKKESQTEEK